MSFWWLNQTPEVNTGSSEMICLIDKLELAESSETEKCGPQKYRKRQLTVTGFGDNSPTDLIFLHCCFTSTVNIKGHVGAVS